MAVDFENKQNLVAVLFTANVASQIIKVDMTPSTSTEVNQSYARALSNKISDMPGLTRHGLSTFTSLFEHNLKDMI